MTADATVAVAELLKDLRPGHSEFQLDHFVLQAHGVTLWGAYQQCLRELRARSEALRAGEIARRRLALAAVEAGEQIERQRGCSQVRAEIDRDEAEGAYAPLCALQHDRKREFHHLRRRAAALREALHRDGPLTPERIQALDAEHWYEVVRLRCAFELLANDRVDTATLSLLVALPSEMRQRLGQALHPSRREALMNEALAAQTPPALLAPVESAPC